MRSNHFDKGIRLAYLVKMMIISASYVYDASRVSIAHWGWTKMVIYLHDFIFDKQSLKTISVVLFKGYKTFCEMPLKLV